MEDNGLDGRGLWLSIFAVMFFGAVTSFGEQVDNGTGNNPTFNNPVNSGGGGAGSADQIAADITGRNDVNSINFSDKEGQDNDRRKQSEAARDRANKGKAVAIATGAALTATAIPMLASPIASVRAAGAALMAKAALEFAQAAANKKTADKNNDAANTLKKNTEPGSGAQANTNKGGDTSKEVKEQINSPQLNKMLTDRGVNAEDFTNRLANGELSNAEEVLRAAGDTSSITPEEMAQGESMANKEMAGVVENKRLGYDESNPITAASGPGGGGLGAGPQQAASSDAKTGESLAESLARAGVAPAAATSSFAANQTSPSITAGAAKGGGMDAVLDMLASMHGIPVEVAARLPLSDVLQAVGILKALPKQTIFQLAHRNYRGFGKWRRFQKNKAKNKMVALIRSEKR